MNFFEKLFLSAYLIKTAGIPGGLLARGVRGAARNTGSKIKYKPKPKPKPKPILSPGEQAVANARSNLSPMENAARTQYVVNKHVKGLAPQTPSVAPTRKPILTNVPDGVPTIPAASAMASAPIAAVAPAVAAAMPTGLGLARQGLGQVATGARQALSSGAAAARGGLISAARNPLAQAGGVGLLGGAVGAYGMNRLMGGSAAAQPATPQSSGATTPSMAVTPAPAAIPAPAPDYAAMDAEGMEDMQAPSMAVTPAPAAIPAPAPDYAAMDAEGMEDMQALGAETPIDYNAAFHKYMGSNYNNNSALDQAKMQYLKSLSTQNRELNAANIYNPAYGYGKW